MIKTKPIDLTGKIFNNLYVKKFVENKYGKSLWLCECNICGNEELITGFDLLACEKINHICSKKKIKILEEKNKISLDYIGKRFGRLVIKNIIRKNGHIYCECDCDCGGKTTKKFKNLREGSSKSCGCLRRSKDFVDLTGQKFYSWTVIKQKRENKNLNYWLCKCDCGRKEQVISGYALRKGFTKSCGFCRADRVKRDLTGQKFGRLTVIKRAEKAKSSNNYKWLCICDHGGFGEPKEIKVTDSNLIRGQQSCGCYTKERIREVKEKQAKERPVNINSGINKVYSSYKKRAERNNIDFNLSKEDVKELILKSCFYCGNKEHTSRMQVGKYKTFYYTGIDRVDNNKGYIKGNVVSSCKICAYAKRDFTLEEFNKWRKRVAKKVFFELIEKL